MRSPMKTTVPKLLTAFLIGGTATFAVVHNRQKETDQQLLTVEKQLSITREDLLGYTKFTDYIAEGKIAIAEHMKFLAADVAREYVQVEHIESSTLGIKGNATIILKYAVEYSFGFDLRPDRFTVSGDRNGITITLSKPELVASPAVHILSHEIPSSSIFIDEQGAVIALQQQLFSIAKGRGNDLKNEAAVIALCEKKLADFLRDFLSKQPKVGVIPTIKVAYR